MNKIPVSWLKKYGYCQKQLYLEKNKNIQPKPTKEIKKGTKRHKELNKKHKQQATKKLSINQAIEKSKEEKIIYSTREIFLKDKDLLGRIDYLKIYPTKIKVIDDKPKTTPYHSNKLQLWGYCRLIKNQEKIPNTKIKAAIRNRKTKEIGWEKEFTKNDLKKVNKTISQLRKVLNEKKEPKKPKNENKCKKCNLKKHCKEKTHPTNKPIN